MKIISWLLRALLFFFFFALALNNQHEVVLRFFFGLEWRGPMAMLCLVLFVAGGAVCWIALLPKWWGKAGASKSSDAKVTKDTTNAADPAHSDKKDLDGV